MIVACRHVRDLECFRKDDPLRIENCRRRGVTKTPFLVGLDAPRINPTGRIEADSVKFGKTGVNDDRVFWKLDHVLILVEKIPIATKRDLTKIDFRMLRKLYEEVFKIQKNIFEIISYFFYGF